MGFFSRLKWLLVGEGEAPSNFKAPMSQSGRMDSRPTSRNQSDFRDRGPRERNDNRDSRGGRYNSRDNRDAPQQDSRDRGPRSGNSLDRDGGGNGGGDRYNSQQRDRGPRRSGSQQGGGYSRRDSYSNDGGFPRPIERPAGGPSSTMRPAQSSVPIVAPPVQTARVELQGPEKVGFVTQYNDQERTANIKIEKGLVRSGDWIEIQGNISALRQKIDTIQVDKQSVGEAREGQEASIRVIRPVKVGDAIVRLRG